MPTTRPPIVHSYTRRDRWLRLFIVALAFFAVLAAVTLAGVFTLRLTRAQPGGEAPHPSRVVKVDVAPNG